MYIGCMHCVVPNAMHTLCIALCAIWVAPAACKQRNVAQCNVLHCAVLHCIALFPTLLIRMYTSLFGVLIVGVGWVFILVFDRLFVRFLKGF